MAEEAPKFDARLAEGVAYFEQMLQLMPEDRTTLEFLVVAYDQLGEHEKGQKSLVSLTKILIKENDKAALEGLLPRLEASDNAEAQALVLKVKTMVAPAPDLSSELQTDMPEEMQSIMWSKSAIPFEQQLIAELKDGGIIAEETAALLDEQVASSPIDGRVFLISALQILEKENEIEMEKGIAFLADKYKMPPVPLTGFEPIKELFALYPPVMLRVRGAVPFAKIGSTVLIAMMNPLDEKLKAAFSSIAQSRFYFAVPSAIEEVLGKIFKPAEENK